MSSWSKPERQRFIVLVCKSRALSAWLEGSLLRVLSVYDPVDGAPSGGWPTIISLPGSGARGPASNAKTLAGYDAVGKLIAQYLGGNKDASRTMAATKCVLKVFSNVCAELLADFSLSYPSHRKGQGISTLTMS